MTGNLPPEPGETAFRYKAKEPHPLPGDIFKRDGEDWHCTATGYAEKGVTIVYAVPLGTP